MTISRKLRFLLSSFPLIVLLHGFEEYLMGLFSGTSAQMVNGTSLLPFFASLNQDQAIYVVYFVMLFLFSITIALVFSDSRKAQLLVLTTLGLYCIYQTHHLFEAIPSLQYNPGLVTSLLYVIWGAMFWKELLHLYKTT